MPRDNVALEKKISSRYLEENEW